MQAERVVAVIRGEGKDRHVGSGYRIAGRFVLTAAHCVRGSGHSVWLSDGERDARVVVDGSPADIDLALLEITPTADQEPVAEVAPIQCGRVDRSILGRIDQCLAVGYPKHAARPDALFTTSEVDGWIPAASGLTDTAAGRTEGFLTLKATGTPPRPLPTSQTELGQSPWRGMSGAAVFAQGLMVGVVAEHHLPEGDGSLTVVPIEWVERLPPKNRAYMLRALGLESATKMGLIAAGARARQPWRLDLDEAKDSHWLPNARGAWPSDGNVWHFSGRYKILGELRQWLMAPGQAGEGPEDTRIRLLLGMPGSGKSAILGRLVVLADPVIGSEVPQTADEAAVAPPRGCIDVAVNAVDKDVDAIAAFIAEGLGTEAGTAEQLVPALMRLDRPPTIVVDSVDEAMRGHQRRLIQLLQDLSRIPGVRIIAAVRSNSRTETGDELASLFGSRSVRMQVDAADEYFDANDMLAYVKRTLIAGRDWSAQLEHSPYLVDEIAGAITQIASPIFLLARFSCREIIDKADFEGFLESDWHRILPATMPEAMEGYLIRLEQRFGTAAYRRTLDFLLALAYTYGPGYDSVEQWAAVATAVSSRQSTYAVSDAYEAFDFAGELIEAGDAELRRSPRPIGLIHSEIARILQVRQGKPVVDHASITEVLLHEAPEGPVARQRDWALAGPYARTHTATHAAQCGRLPVLLDDAGFLVFADPASLLSAAWGRPESSAPPIAALQRCYRHVRDCSIDERAAYLEFSARCMGNVHLAARIGNLSLNRPWQVPWFSVMTDTAPGLLIYHTKRSFTGNLAITEIERRPTIAFTESDFGNYKLILLDLLTGEQLNYYEAEFSRMLDMSVQFIGTNLLTAVSYEDGCYLWRPSQGVWARLEGRQEHDEESRPIAVSVGDYNGKPIALTVDFSGRATMWDLESWLSGQRPVTAVASWPWSTETWRVGHDFTPFEVLRLGGRSVAALSVDHEMAFIFDITTGAMIGGIELGKRNEVSSFAIGYINDEAVGLLGMWHGTVQVCELSTGRRYWLPIHHTSHVEGAATFRADGRDMLVTISGGDLRIWNIDDLLGSRSELIAIHREDKSTPSAITIGGRAGQHIAMTGAEDGSVTFFDCRDGKAMCDPIGAHDGEVTSVAAAADGDPYAVTGGRDGTLRFWDLTSCQPSSDNIHTQNLPGRVYIGGEMAGFALGSHPSWHPAERTVSTGTLQGRKVAVSGGDDGLVRVWDLETRAPLGAPIEVGRPVDVVAVGPEHNGKTTVAIGYSPSAPLEAFNTGPFQFYDLGSGELITQARMDFNNLTGSISAAGLSKIDSHTIWAFLSASMLERWDLTSQQPSWARWRLALEELPEAMCVGEYADRALAFVANETGDLHSYDLRDGQIVLRISLDVPIKGLAYHPPNGLVIASPYGLLRLDLTFGQGWPASGVLEEVHGMW